MNWREFWAGMAFYALLALFFGSFMGLPVLFALAAFGDRLQ